jgi:dsRNA-specific ribonuclease
MSSSDKMGLSEFASSLIKNYYTSKSHPETVIHLKLVGYLENFFSSKKPMKFHNMADNIADILQVNGPKNTLKLLQSIIDFTDVLGYKHDQATDNLVPKKSLVPEDAKIEEDKCPEEPKKIAKRRYIGLDQPEKYPVIVNDYSPENFRGFLFNLISTRGKIEDKKRVEQWLSGSLIDEFIKAFTHDSVKPLDPAYNYELMEHFGDATINKIITWYLKSRFPSQVKAGNPSVIIFSKQEALLKSKERLAHYSVKLGLDKWVRYRPLEFEIIQRSKLGNYTTIKRRVTLDRSMKEDVFESFFACLEDVIDRVESSFGVGPGVGYNVCYHILSSVLDDEQIPTSLNELLDARTKLKEVLEKSRPIKNAQGQVIQPGDTYEFYTSPDNSKRYLRVDLVKIGNESRTFGPYNLLSADTSTVALIIKEADKNLSNEALNWIKKFGVTYASIKGLK